MIKINGKYIRNIPEQVGKNKRDIFQLDTDLSALEVKVNEALAGVFHYKGSVATYSDLPASDNEVGDVYNVIDTGKNYAWDGSVWDDLGGLVDLSNYVTLDSEQTITGDKTFDNEIKVSNGTASFYITNNGWSTNLRQQGGITVTLSGNNFLPASNDAYSLGSSSQNWKDLYLSGKAYIGSTANGFESGSGYFGMKYNNSFYIALGNSGIVAYDTLLPNSNNAYDLGTSSKEWKDLYISGKIYSDYIYSNSYPTTGLNLANGSVRSIGHFYPQGNNLYSLGAAALPWKNLYLAGDLTNGTDSVTVADLAALITYAKAQGWIS